ncbi:hypothetical protein N9J88_03300 [Porticoccaceae bacterium]|nr:hypothetical protein [Porticoccaceae bacterium]
MAFFYIKNGFGTRVIGGGLTKQSGSFDALGAANVYATIAAAIADGATAGDMGLASHLHDFDSVGVTIVYTGPTTGFLALTSVDDANCDQPLAGAIERTTSGSQADIDVSGLIAAWGITFTFADDFRMVNPGTQFRGYGCKLGPVNATDGIRSLADGQSIELHDCEVEAGHNAAQLFISEYACLFKMFGGIFHRNGAGINHLSDGNFGGAGGSIELYGVDLVDVTSHLFFRVGSNFTSDDRIVIKMDLCALSAAVDTGNLFFDEDFVKPGNEIDITRSSSSSATAEHRYYRKDFGGEITDNTSFYRDASDGFLDSGQQVSLRVDTNANSTIFSPLVFDFPTTAAELSSAASNKLRIYLLSADVLTDADIWAEAIYPYGTSKNVAIVASSNSNTIAGSFVVNPLSAGTALASNTEAWTGHTTENRYQLDIDTSGSPGADCVPLIRLYVAKPSTVYLDTDVDVVS